MGVAVALQARHAIDAVRHTHHGHRGTTGHLVARRTIDIGSARAYLTTYTRVAAARTTGPLRP